MKSFTNGSTIKVQGKKFMHYGTVGTLKNAYERSDYFRTKFADYEKEFLPEMYRRQEGERYQAFGIQRSLMICADRGYYEEKRKWEATCEEVTNGEIVLVDGVQMKVRFVGDYSDFVKFYPV